MFVDPFSAQYLNGVDHRLCVVDAGLRIHLQEPELHGRLRLRELVLRVTRRADRPSPNSHGTVAPLAITPGPRARRVARARDIQPIAWPPSRCARQRQRQSHERFARSSSRPRRHRAARRQAHRDAHPRRTAAGEPHVVLGLATGSTPIGVYRELIRMHREEGLSFATSSRSISTSTTRCRRRAFTPTIDSCGRISSRTSTSIRRTSTSPPATWPRDGDRRRRRARTSRRSCAPAASTSRSSASARPATSDSTSPAPARRAARDSSRSTHVTRRDAAADFFGEDYVPREAVTMGIATILDAREIAIIATGEHKSSIVRARRRRRDRSSRSRRRSCSGIPTRRSTSIAPRPPSSRASRRRG